MVIIGFASIATDIAPRMFSSFELGLILRGAEQCLEDYSTEAVDAMLVDWETTLLWSLLHGEPQTAEWYMRALLIVCMRGLRGEIRPDFTWINHD